MRYLLCSLLCLTSWCFGDSDTLYQKAHALASQPGVTHTQLQAAVQAIGNDAPYAEEGLFLLGIWDYRKGDFSQAYETLAALMQNYPNSAHRAEALFYMARSLDQSRGDLEKIAELMHAAYETDPTATFSDEAYFFAHRFEDYLDGKPKALAHLQAMESQFPQSPYRILAHYLHGMAFKRSALSKNQRTQQTWNAAIATFEQAQTVFDKLASTGKIPTNQSDTFTAIRLRAEIERAQANIAVAMQSSSAKQQICLEYAIASFRNLRQLLRDSQEPLFTHFRRSDAHAALLEECDFGLAQAYVKAGNDSTAKEILEAMLQEFETNQISRGYYLAKAHTELANIAERAKDHTTALQHYVHADEAAKGRVLNTDERLELWICQSRCQQALGNSEAAMRLLSQVINDDSISGLRLKAMQLRAELYEQQNRPELAQKQLMALVRKGGEWAQQAKIKLDKDYGIHSSLPHHSSSDLPVQR